MEEVGTVMGGGALKLDAVQLNKIILPKTILQDLSSFSRFGAKLAKESFNTCGDIIEEIDSKILHLMGIDDATKSEDLESINEEFLRGRGAI